MKKLFLLSMMCLMALAVQAQRCAVFHFNAGKGVAKEDVEGISYIFNSNFFPEGYTMLERSVIDKTIEKEGFSRTGMTQQQMLRVGRVLNATYIAVGEMTVFMDEYNVDARIIDVATGGTVAAESASFSRTKYRDKMKRVAKRLAEKVVRAYR